MTNKTYRIRVLTAQEREEKPEKDAKFIGLHRALAEAEAKLTAAVKAEGVSRPGRVTIDDALDTIKIRKREAELKSYAEKYDKVQRDMRTREAMLAEKRERERRFRELRVQQLKQAQLTWQAQRVRSGRGKV